MNGNNINAMMVADRMTVYIIQLPEPEWYLYPIDAIGVCWSFLADTDISGNTFKVPGNYQDLFSIT